MKVNVTIGIRDWLDRIFVWPILLYRFCKFGYAFRRIYLGEGQWTILEQEDYYCLRNYKWVVHANGKGGQNLYAIRHKLVSPNKTKMIYMHREIMKPTDDRFVDHKNCNSLDNRRANLRFATRAENMQNRRKKKNTTSRFVGVHLYKPSNRWVCRITYQGKRIVLGRFDSEIAAAKAYDEAAKKYFGEFARLNFPQEDERSRALFTRIGKMWTRLVGQTHRSARTSRQRLPLGFVPIDFPSEKTTWGLRPHRFSFGKNDMGAAHNGDKSPLCFVEWADVAVFFRLWAVFENGLGDGDVGGVGNLDI